jgi:hypothetical protein
LWLVIRHLSVVIGNVVFRMIDKLPASEMVFLPLVKPMTNDH